MLADNSKMSLNEAYVSAPDGSGDVEWTNTKSWGLGYKSECKGSMNMSIPTTISFSFWAKLPVKAEGTSTTEVESSLPKAGSIL